ncbi:MAG: SRPBCC family protein [Thermodesulfobacteriota bacterium]
MTMQHIEIIQIFNAPVGNIFNLLTDHESFGRIIKTKIRRVVDSNNENKNGKGSVRKVNVFPLPAFEESVITFDPNNVMEYVVSKGSPIKNHKGRMEFLSEHGKTRLIYTIDFEPKLPFFFLGGVLKKAIEKPLKKGFVQLAQKYDNPV